MLVDRFVRHLPALKADADDLIQWYSTVANCGGASKNERLDRERKKRKKTMVAAERTKRPRTILMRRVYVQRQAETSLKPTGQNSWHELGRGETMGVGGWRK